MRVVRELHRFDDHRPRTDDGAGLGVRIVDVQVQTPLQGEIVLLVAHLECDPVEAVRAPGVEELPERRVLVVEVRRLRPGARLSNTTSLASCLSSPVSM